jgi:hypothetical protein
VNNLYSSTTSHNIEGILRMFEEFSYFAYILTQGNNKTLNFSSKVAPSKALQKLYGEIWIAK